MRSTSAAVLLPILLLSNVPRTAVSAVKNLPADVRAALKQATGFQIRASVSAIPSSVRSSFAKAAGEKSFSMAEPGADWQSTDVIYKPRLPRRRLGKVALSKSFCILFYELGGIGWSYHVAVFHLTQDGATLVWRGFSFHTIVDPAGLMIAIDKGEIDDDPKYSL